MISGKNIGIPKPRMDKWKGRGLGRLSDTMIKRPEEENHKGDP